MKEGRLPLKPTLDEFAANSFPVEPTPENFEARYSTNPEQKALDFYALLVPAIKEVVDAALAESPEPPKNVTDFPSLESRAKSLLKESIRDYTDTRSPSDPLAVLAENRYKNLEELLTRGSNTAVRFMNGTLHWLPVAFRMKYQAKPTTDQLMGIAEKNYPFVVMNAGHHVKNIVALQNLGKRFGTESFSTSLSYAQLDDMDTLFFPAGEPLHLPNGPQLDHGVEREAIGCPALYSKAIYSLWNWHLVGAERIFRHNLGERESLPHQGEIYRPQASAAD